METSLLSDVEIKNHVEKISKDGFTIIENVLSKDECKNISDR